jgi:ATP-dependent Lhr-like helicase
LPSATPPHAAGRWYLTSSLLSFQPSVEETALATIDTLLDRHGIVTRDVVINEGVTGGFAGMYPALSSLEDVGRVRRGYFIDGFGGAQFGLPGAIDRLRLSHRADFIVMAAADPANPFGATIPWPDTEGRSTRIAGARVAVEDGHLLAWIDPAGRRVCVFTDDPQRASAAIEALARTHTRASLSHIGTTPIHDHELAAELLDHAFNTGYKGFTLNVPGPINRR